MLLDFKRRNNDETWKVKIQICNEWIWYNEWKIRTEEIENLQMIQRKVY